MRWIAPALALVLFATSPLQGQPRCVDLADTDRSIPESYLLGYVAGLQAGFGIAWASANSRLKKAGEEGADGQVISVLRQMELEFTSYLPPEGIHLDEVATRVRLLCNRSENADAYLLEAYRDAVREISRSDE